MNRGGAAVSSLSLLRPNKEAGSAYQPVIFFEDLVNPPPAQIGTGDCDLRFVERNPSGLSDWPWNCHQLTIHVEHEGLLSCLFVEKWRRGTICER